MWIWKIYTSELKSKKLSGWKSWLIPINQALCPGFHYFEKHKLGWIVTIAIFYHSWESYVWSKIFERCITELRSIIEVLVQYMFGYL